MRIIQVIQKKQFRGAEVFAAQLSQRLKALGHHVLIICLIDGKVELPFDGEVICIKANIHNRFFDFSAWKLLAERIEEFKPDIVQANASDTLKYTVLSKILFRWNAKIVFRNANKLGDFIKSKPHFLLNKWFISKVDFIASVSNLCKEDFIKTFNYSPKEILTLPIGVEDSKQAPYENLTFLGIPLNRKVLLSVASFVPEKNHVGLISIFRKIHDEHKDTHLLLIGEGKQKERIMSLVKEYDLNDFVLFTSERKDIQLIMPCCNALLMPSHIEGLPAVILEAFISKLPVVAYNVGGIAEVLNNKTGWLIAKDLENDFADAVCEILNKKNKQMVEEKLLNAFSLCHNFYLNTGIASRFSEMYKNLIGKEKN